MFRIISSYIHDGIQLVHIIGIQEEDFVLDELRDHHFEPPERCRFMESPGSKVDVLIIKLSVVWCGSLILRSGLEGVNDDEYQRILAAKCRQQQPLSIRSTAWLRAAS